MSFGYTLSLLSYCYGLKGIMCMMVYLLPHGFIYVPLILMILKGTSTKIYDDYYLNYKKALNPLDFTENYLNLYNQFCE